MRVPQQGRPLGGAASNPTPSGHHNSGTLGGQSRMGIGARPGGKQLALGDEVYLWILVLVEVGLMGWARQQFRRHHGG